MFEQYANYFWLALFIALVFYGFWKWIGAPFLIRKFYRENNFAAREVTNFNDTPYDGSLLLQRMSAATVYSGEYKGYTLEQFEAFTDASGRFPSKAVKKKNRVAWTVTLLRCDRELVSFCARPTRAKDAIEYLLNTDVVDFPDDEVFANSMHVISENPSVVRAAMGQSVRSYLNHIDPLSLESTGSMLVLKSPRQPHDTGQKLLGDLDMQVEIYQQLLAGAS